MLIELLTVPGRYLLAVPRIDLIDEQIQFLLQSAKDLGVTPPAIREAHSGVRSRENVARQIEEAARDLAAREHAILIITHESLKSYDLSQFKGWHLRIDEIPDGVTSGSFRASASSCYLDAAYQLESVLEDADWQHVALQDSAPRIKDVIKDDLVKDLAQFHKYVTGPQSVYVNLTAWPDAEGQSRNVEWWSLWPALCLGHFASVIMTGASFQKSLWCQATSYVFGNSVRFEEVPVGDDGLRASPKVRLNYFTAGHTGSTSFWSESRGRWCLNLVARYFENLGGVDYWSGNEVVRSYFEHRFPGQMVLPKLAGSNSLIEHTSCASIYGNKAQDADSAILEVFPVDRDIIKHARETEDLFQFIMRGAIRRPEFDGTYDVYLYDLTQAQALANLLLEGGITDDVDVVQIDEAGLIDEERLSSSNGSASQSDRHTRAEREAARLQKDAARKRVNRAKDREEKAAAGTLRPRGRPPKSNSQFS
jgi:hypothetical protein